MRHYLMTRSAYGPAWDLAANRRRLAVTRAVTAKLARAQTVPFTWVVFLDARDPLLSERMSLYATACDDFKALVCRPPEAPREVAADWMPDWRSVVQDDEPVLMTRLDDDDGLAADALARIRRAAAGRTERTILMLPQGYRIWDGRFSEVRHERNAWQTLLTFPGDTLSVYDYGHTEAPDIAPVVMVDDRPGWLWMRHRDTISGLRQADLPLLAGFGPEFPVNWPDVMAAWA